MHWVSDYSTIKLLTLRPDLCHFGQSWQNLTNSGVMQSYWNHAVLKSSSTAQQSEVVHEARAGFFSTIEQPRQHGLIKGYQL